MSKCLIVAACIFAAVAAGDASEGSFSSDSDSTSGSGAPAPYVPPFAGSCPYNGVVDGMITSLITYAQGGTISINDAATKFNYKFTPCRRQVGLGVHCTQDESQPVSTTAGLVVHRDGQCNSKTDIYFATRNPTFQNNGWIVMYDNYEKSFFNLTIMCEKGATNKFLVNGANFLTIADERACPVNATTVAPINVTADACTATFDDSTMVSTLDTFSTWFTSTFRGNAALPNVLLNPCGTQSFSDSSFVKGCPTTMGYLAFLEGDKCTVLDQRMATFYPDGEFGQYWMNRYFTTRPKSTNNRGFQQQIAETETISRSVRVACGTEEAFTGKSTDANGEEVYSFTSVGACGAAATPAPVTNAPSQKPKSGLTTGEVVGIVIGALALIVIILVCLRWRSAKGEEEGEYQRV